mgnify:CR=1 FL=1
MSLNQTHKRANIFNNITLNMLMALQRLNVRNWLSLCENVLITFSNKYRILMVSQSQNKIINHSIFAIIFIRLIDYMLAICHVILKVHLAPK